MRRSRAWIVLSALTACLVSLAARAEDPESPAAHDEATSTAAVEAEELGESGDFDDFEGFDDFVDVETIDSVEVVVEPPPTKLELAGRLHAAVVHFPIAFVFLAVLTELLAITTRRSEYELAARYVLVVTCLSAIPSLATGALRGLDSVAFGVEAGARAIAHGNEVGAGLAAATVALWLRERKHPWVARLLLLAALVLVAHGAHLGGELVYGEEFFPF